MREARVLVPAAPGVEISESDEGSGEQRELGPRREEAPRQTMTTPLARYAILGGIFAIPLLAVPTVGRYALLAKALWQRPVVERGSVASNEYRNFLSLAGRPKLRARVASAIREGEAKSGVANGWRWAFAASLHLPPDARIYLNVPNLTLYYYSTFFWFPRRVDVNPNPQIVTDAITLELAAMRLERARLRELGYTHVVDRSARGMAIFDLAREDTGP